MCDGWGKSWAIGLLAVVKAFGELAWCCRLEVEGMRGRGVRKMLEEEGAGGGLGVEGGDCKEDEWLMKRGGTGELWMMDRRSN